MTDKDNLSSYWPDYTHTGDIALKKQQSLRRLVGTLGMLLPVFLFSFLFIFQGYDHVLPSISHYFFTRAASVFEIIVSLMAIFLMIHKGEEPIDFILSMAAGISALLMLLFPTDNLMGYLDGKFDSVVVTEFPVESLYPTFHYICASIFLLCLAYMSLFLFTKSDKDPVRRGREKNIRNLIYRICGIVMAAAMATALMGFIGIISREFYDAHNFTFWMEVIAVESFGVAWMVKGGVVLKDKER